MRNLMFSSVVLVASLVLTPPHVAESSVNDSSLEDLDAVCAYLDRGDYSVPEAQNYLDEARLNLGLNKVNVNQFCESNGLNPKELE
jgi:hypothetical protein